MKIHYLFALMPPINAQLIRLSLSKGEGRVRVQDDSSCTPHLNPLPSLRGEAKSCRLVKTAGIIRSRSATSRAFADNADDILPRARISAQVQFALPLAGQNACSCPPFFWMLLPSISARANDKKSPSDIAFPHPVPAGSG
jgi:hypothetical protein